MATTTGLLTKVRCPERGRFSVTVIKADGQPQTVYACRHHIGPILSFETCAIANSSGGRPAIVLPVKPVRRCDRWEEPAS